MQTSLQPSHHLLPAGWRGAGIHSPACRRLRLCCLLPACLPYSQGGFLYSVLMPAVGLGLPFALAVFPVHAWRYWRACKAAKQGGKASIDQWATPYSHNNDLLDAACYVVSYGCRRLAGCLVG